MKNLNLNSDVIANLLSNDAPSEHIETITVTYDAVNGYSGFPEVSATELLNKKGA